MSSPEPASPGVPDGRRLARTATALLAAAQFSAFVDRATPTVMAPLLKTQFALTDAQIGWLIGPAFVMVYGLGLLAAGQWGGRFNPWRLAGICVLTWSAGGIVFALSADYAGLLVGRLLLGVGQAAFAPAAFLLIGGQAEATRRARGLSWLTAGSAGGRSGALILGGALLSALGANLLAGLEPWRAVSIVIMLPNLVLAALLLRQARGWTAPTGGAGVGLAQALGVVGRRPTAFLGLATAAAGCVLIIQAAGAWNASILNRAFGLEPGDAALVFGAVVLMFAPLGHLGGGWIMGSRVGQAWGAGPFIALGVASAALSALFLASAPGLGVALALMAVLTAGAGLAAAVALINLQELTEAPLRAPVGALFLVVTSIVGVGAGPWLTGWISDALSARGQSLPLALAATTGAAAVAVILVCLAAGRLWPPQPVRIGE